MNKEAIDRTKARFKPRHNFKWGPLSRKEIYTMILMSNLMILFALFVL